MFDSALIIPPKKSVSNLWMLPYYLLLIAGVTLPSDGNHGLFTLKSLGFLSTLGAGTLYVAIHPKLTRGQWQACYGFLLFMTLMGLWIFIGDMRQGTPWESQLDQFKVFLITGFVFVASLYYIYEGLITTQALFKAVIYANFVYALGKVLVVAGHLLDVFNLFDILHILGFRFMSMGMIGDFSRLQTSVDILTPYFMFFVLQSESLGLKFPRGFKTLYIVIAWISILLSFSRYLLFVGIVGYALYLATLTGSRFVKVLGIGSLIGITAIGVIGIENTQLLIQKRLFSTETTLSDLTRVRQIEDVLQEFEKAPLLGKGMGSYAEGNVRDSELRHSYEVQWAAFLMQFGIIGILLLLIPVGIIAWSYLAPPFSMLKMTFFLLFLLWLLSGFTNPFLISLGSGIIYTLFYLAGKHLAIAKHNFT